jgi:hypothetical protein
MITIKESHNALNTLMFFGESEFRRYFEQIGVFFDCFI